MSLVSTWVEAVNGLMYKNPILEDDDFFICFDDDDPPEIVIRKSSNRAPQQIFESIGVYADKIRNLGTSGRCFGNKIVTAQSYFFELLRPIPIPQKFDDCRTWAGFEERKFQCCYIAFKGRN